MRRLTKELGKKATRTSIAMLATIHTEIAPQLRAMRQADVLMDGLRGRPKGSDKQPTRTFESIAHKVHCSI